MSVQQACCALYVGRAAGAECGLQASNMKINAQNEEWTNIRIIICTVLLVCLFVYCCNKNQLMAMGKIIKYANYSLGCCVFNLRQFYARSKYCE
jgi:hypothetical protein